jgi:hypothetical protein
LARIIRFLIATLLAPNFLAAQSKPAPRDVSTPGNSLCYAFFSKGDVWTVCQGKRERIGLHGTALDFAVSTDGSNFAVQENLESSGIGRTRQVLVFLSPAVREKSREVNYPELLSGTCGTIASFEVVSRRPFDLVNSRPMESPPYKYFRCSADKRTTAGITTASEANWYSRRKTDPADSTNGFLLKLNREGEESEFQVVSREVFDVSPSGKYFVSIFSPVVKQAPLEGLCIVGPKDEHSCINQHADAVSVSDRGEVLFWVGELGTMYWHSGLEEPQLLEKGAEKQPQWITPEVATALHQWNTIQAATVSAH